MPQIARLDINGNYTFKRMVERGGVRCAEIALDAKLGLDFSALDPGRAGERRTAESPWDKFCGPPCHCCTLCLTKGRSRGRDEIYDLLSELGRWLRVLMRVAHSVVKTSLIGASVCLVPASFLGAEDNLHAQLLPEGKQNHAYRWLNITQEVAARDVDRHGARPTVLSRTMAIWATAMYDAWTAYDDKAVGSRLGGMLRRPPEERTLENKNKAISYASYNALLDVVHDDREYLAGEMKKLGYDPSLRSTDPKTAEGVGYLAAKALREFRHHDGANQLGDEAGSSGEPYSDYTFYRCVNTAEKCLDPDCWQPITFTRPDGSKACPEFLTPHWYRVKPFVLESAAQFRPPPPPTIKKDAELLKKEVDQVLAYNRDLTPEQKAIVEFMRDGPRSTGQSGHWLRFAQDVSRRDRHDLDTDVKLYFTIANIAFDAFISCWETKRVYDSSRPWTLIRYFYAGKRVKGWAGLKGGVKEMPVEQWRPYSPEMFITPPFPGYTSGHATVSGACAKSLELFTGSDHFGFQERRACCALTEKDPGEVVTLDLPTFSATAEMAAVSRAMGGYHIPIDNKVGLQVGRKLAEWSWRRFQEYFAGTARVAPASQIAGQ